MLVRLVVFLSDDELIFLLLFEKMISQACKQVFRAPKYFNVSFRFVPFLTVDATTGNQTFSHDRCSTFPGLNYNEANDTFLNSPRTNNVEVRVEITLKVMERARVTCY